VVVALSGGELAVQEADGCPGGLRNVRFLVVEADVLAGVQPQDLLFAGLSACGCNHTL
jgi:hypothetical protein